MKSKLLSAICLPAALAVCSAAAMAQEPAPSPSQAPAEKMEQPSAPPSVTPSPAPEAAPMPAPSSESSASSESKSTAGTFASAQSADEWRSTKLVGLNVYNAANEKVGDINDLIMGPDGKIVSAVIGVGGFLGLGEKLVAVSFSDLTLNRDGDGTVRVTLNSTKEALESAPDFKYYKAPQITK